MPLEHGADLPLSSTLILLGMAAAVLLAVVEAWVLAIGRLVARRPLVPNREGGPVPWGGGMVLLCFAVWQAATLVASTILHARRGDGGDLSLIDQIAAVTMINLALVAILPALLVLLRGATPADFGFRRGTIGGDLILGIVAALFAVPLVYAVQFAAILVWEPTAHPLQEMLMRERSPWVMALAFVSAVVLAPAAEELLFRGILQGWLERRLRPMRSDSSSPGSMDEGTGWGPGPSDLLDAPWQSKGLGPLPTDWAVGGDRTADGIAIVFPAAFFAAVHAGQWPAPLPLFVLALGLGLLYRRTKGIVAPIAMHATFNGLSTTAMIVVVLVTPGPAPEPDVPPVTVEPAATAAPEVEAHDPADASVRGTGPGQQSHPNVESAGVGVTFVGGISSETGTSRRPTAGPRS